MGNVIPRIAEGGVVVSTYNNAVLCAISHCQGNDAEIKLSNLGCYEMRS